MAIAASAQSGSVLSLVDTSGDDVRFQLAGEEEIPRLELWVGDELFADDVDVVRFDSKERRFSIDGTIDDEEDGESYEVDGEFQVAEAERNMVAATLALLVARAPRRATVCT